MMNLLSESLSFDQARVIVESANEGKDLFMKGICIQGGVRNANQRVYPVNEISRAVTTLNEQIGNGFSVLGEVDHPEGLNINIDRVSHMITDMWMDGPNGYGKLKILPTPMGQLVKTMLESGVKLGVSSRGSGNVSEDGSGKVADFEIINESKSIIDSVKISCSGTNYRNKSVITKLLPKERSKLTLNMNDVKKIDGNYFIEIFKKAKNTNKAFGYYSNGCPTNSIYKLIIKKDTILVKERMK